MKLITLLALVLTVSSCSMSGPKEEVAAEQKDDLEFVADAFGDEAVKTEDATDEQVANTDMATTPEEQKMAEAMTPPAEPKMEEFKDQQPIPEVVAQTEMPRVESAPTYGQEETYVVGKGETLMMVAFKIYGDYGKWRDLKEWNKDKGRVVEGVRLKYYAPDRKFVWKPNGLPYLVKKGDTLVLISEEKYGTPKKWKAIFDNNRPLIKDPNLIFAGFTVYYEPERDVASEKK